MPFSLKVNQALLQAEQELVHKKGDDPATLLDEIQSQARPLIMQSHWMQR